MNSRKGYRRDYAWPRAARVARIWRIGGDEVDMTPAFGVRVICGRGPYKVVLTCPSQRRLTSRAARAMNRALGWKTRSIAAEQE